MRNIQYILLSLIAFSIPLEKRLVPYLIALYCLYFILSGNILDKLKKIVNSRYVLVTIGYYAFLVFGLIYTDNLNAGLFDLEVKLSLLLFPILFASVDLTKSQFNSVISAFLLSCAIALVICLSYALVYFFSTNNSSVFYYDKLSVFHHPTYFSMYFNFAILILYYFLIYDQKAIRLNSTALYILLIVLFSLFVVLLSSKIGLITLMMIIFFGTLLWFIESRAIFPSIMVFTMLTVLIYVSFKYSNIIQGRIQEAYTSISAETPQFSTTGARILIWEIALDLIAEKPMLGHGTGDVKDELVRKYEKLQYTDLFNKKLNAHNEYLQMFIAIGLLGGLFYLAYLYYPLLQKRTLFNLLYIGFIILISLNFLTESMLETQAGVVFYAFFNALLFFNQDKIVPLRFKKLL